LISFGFIDNIFQTLVQEQYNRSNHIPLDYLDEEPDVDY